MAICSIFSRPVMPSDHDERRSCQNGRRRPGEPIRSPPDRNQPPVPQCVPRPASERFRLPPVNPGQPWSTLNRPPEFSRPRWNAPPKNSCSSGRIRFKIFFLSDQISSSCSSCSSSPSFLPGRSRIEICPRLRDSSAHGSVQATSPNCHHQRQRQAF